MKQVSPMSNHTAPAPVRKRTPRTPAINENETVLLQTEVDPSHLPEGLVASLEVRRLPIDELRPHPRNTEIRKHPEKGSARWNVLAESIRHDYFDPVVFNLRNGFLVSGHLRTKVLADLGYSHVDAIIKSYDEPTHLARMMAANRLIGEDDVEGQKALLIDLRSVEGFDFALAGLTTLELDKIAPVRDFEIPNEWEDGSGVANVGIDGSELRTTIVLTCPQAKAKDVERLIEEHLLSDESLRVKVLKNGVGDNDDAEGPVDYDGDDEGGFL